MKLAFVHGWSVHHTDTYGALPSILADAAPARGLSLERVDIQLGRYISFVDTVRMDDVVRALNRALRDAMGDGHGGIAPFACITHSTGGPVVREWVMRFHGADPASCPLTHLIMLAPANHGSALAVLGSARLGRLKAWAEGIEPGARILEWLELGSTGARTLNHAWIDLPTFEDGGGLRSFVLTGQTVDKAFYDYVNSYTGELGGDGVVRVAAANLAYGWLSLRQTGTPAGADATLLEPVGEFRRTAPIPFRVLPDTAHSGDKLGIMRSATPDKPVVPAILDALATSDSAAYTALRSRWEQETSGLQSAPGHRYFQIIAQVTDDQGAGVPDFDLILLAGPDYSPEDLPKGFYVDKQRNPHSPERITFFLDYDVMMGVPARKFGFRVVARPDRGFARYQPAEFRSDAHTIDVMVDPNTTLYVDIVLHRVVDIATTRFSTIAGAPGEFRRSTPAGIPVD